jgi:hypothetical protein
MEKEMHNLYLSGNYRDMNITSSFLMWRYNDVTDITLQDPR